MATIQLIQFRNYKDATFEIGDHTILIGPNGSGKTNIIEAVRTLSVTKSYRVKLERDAILWNEDYCRLIWRDGDDSLEFVLTTEAFGTRKAMKRNGAGIPLSQVYGILPTVLFSPESMELIEGDPAERRRFLDTLLCQADRLYLEALMNYRKVIRERHFILLRLQQGLGDAEELDFWDAELVKSGHYLMDARQKLTIELNNTLAEIYPTFANNDAQEKLVIDYKMSAPPKLWPKKLQDARFYDIKTAVTNVGPHRDDLVFLLGDRDVTKFASRGELRRSVISTKLAETIFLEKALGRKPIVLLDDVFSELDSKRRKNLLSAIKDYNSIITSTDVVRGADQLSNVIVHQLER